jgi:hypothetical protein
MAATREAWMTASTLPKGSSYETMLEFFGIPPYTAERLDENILKKRRDWHHKTNSGNPVGRTKAKEVVALIQRIAQTLKRGVPDEEGGGAAAEIPDAVFETLEELWRIISEYVFADDFDQALQVAHEAVSRWGMTPDAASVLAWVVATGFNTGNIAHPALLTEGLSAADTAVGEQPGETRNWESKISLLMASSRVPDAIATIDEAQRSLGGRMTARLHLARARATISLNRAEEATVAAVRGVHTALLDADVVTAVRSEATDLLVTWLAANLLPIKSTADLGRYVEMVNAAAWCSDGVPEAEDIVRVHRMWAANAGQRVFVGSWKLRSFLAVCTGFISLPIHNYVRSSLAWEVFAKGLAQEKRDFSFAVVASPQYVQRAHNMNFVVMIDDA